MSTCDEDGSLVALTLGFQQLQGSLPLELGLLTDLRFLSLRRNLLTGTIPRSIGALTNLVLLDLGRGTFESTLPTELGLLTNLQELRAHESPSIFGPIPDGLASLSNLLRLNLHNSQLTGSLEGLFCDAVMQKRLERGTSFAVHVSVDCDQVQCPCCDAWGCF